MTNELLFLCDATVCGCESDSLQSSSSTGIVVGVVVGLLGVAVGISGLIGAAFIAKRHRCSVNFAMYNDYCENRPEPGRKKGEMATEENPAYGMSAPRGRAPPETNEIPQFTQPPSTAPEEGVYEGVC